MTLEGETDDDMIEGRLRRGSEQEDKDEEGLDKSIKRDRRRKRDREEEREGGIERDRDKDKGASNREVAVWTVLRCAVCCADKGAAPSAKLKSRRALIRYGEG